MLLKMKRTGLRAIEAQIQKLTAQAQKLKEKARSDALRRILGLMRDNELSIEDVSGAVQPQKKRASTKSLRGRAPRATRSRGYIYRHPSGAPTWSGFGPTPKWLKAELDAGKDLLDFRVDGEA